MRLPFNTPKRITQVYGQTNAALTGGTHYGTDYALAMNTPLYAMLAGEVVAVSYDKVSGNFILVKAGNIEYGYFHMNRIDVARRQRVAEGQLLGLAGSTGASTGPHLHLQTKVNGQLVDPERVLAGAYNPAPSKKSNDDVAAEVIRGDWGNGSDRVARLRAAGYDPAAIQAIVNQRLA